EPRKLRQEESMADAGTKLTPQQKIEMARKAIDGISRGDVNPERFSGDAVMRGSLMGEVRGRDAVVAALKKMPTMFEEFRQAPHAILADNDHIVALINLKVKSGGKTIEAQQVLQPPTQAAAPTELASSAAGWSAAGGAVRPALPADIQKAQKRVRQAWQFIAFIGALSVVAGTVAELGNIDLLQNYFDWYSVA